MLDQFDCTTVICAGQIARVDEWKNLIVTEAPRDRKHDASSAPRALDAVDLEVIKASLSGIVQEMQNSLFRTGFSTIVRESQDASCAMMNAQGRGGGAACGAAAAYRRVSGLLRRRARRIMAMTSPKATRS